MKILVLFHSYYHQSILISFFRFIYRVLSFYDYEVAISI